MKIGEFREMNSEELHGELERLRRHQFDLRAQAVTEKLQNSNQLRYVKHDIARVLTLLLERGETGIEQQQRHLEAMSAREART